MSQAYSGVGGNVLVGAVDCDASGWNFDHSVNTFDSTTTADLGWDDETAATERIEGSVDFFYNKDKDPYSDMSMRPGTTVAQMTLYVNKDDDVKFQGKALIKKISVKTKTKDGVLLTASFMNKGPWTGPWV